jgi:ribosomal protein S18 acetylase RimI-like enzyme
LDSSAWPADGIRPASSADVPALVGLLCRAFDADALANWALRRDGRRGAAFAWFYRLSLDLTLPRGHVVVTEDGLGTALWTPPGPWRESWVRELWRLPGFVRAIGVRRAPGVLRAFAALEARHPGGAHYYLMELAVDPRAQGRGIGSALLRHGLARCDERRVGAYLENSNPRNTPLYERHGFRLVERHDLGAGGPPVWLMWRDPAG